MTVVTFVVNAEASDDQTVCVVGDDERIGSWNPQRAVRMKKDVTEQKRWSCSVTLNQSTDYSYRFFVGKSRKNIRSKDELDEDLIVVQWETNLRPRQFSSGSNTSLKLPEAHFGAYDSTWHVSNGWLMDQCETQLRLHTNPVTMWKPQDTSQVFSVKCGAVDCSLNQEVDENEDRKHSHTSEVLASNLAEADCQPRPQGSTGVVCSYDDYIIFRARSSDTNLMGFHFDVYAHGFNRLPELIGSAHLLPLLQKKSKFCQTLPIIGLQGKPVGAINVEILVVRSIPDVTLAMESSFVNYWNRGQWGQKALDIGHRGLGESYSLFNYKRENTLGSFKEAAEHGADCVEFDVVMTKDHFPVIYHDFTVKIACANEKERSAGLEHDLHEIPVKDLTLRQLQSLKIVTIKSGESITEITDQSNSSSCSEAFPTLAHCLQHADDRLSFNVEIKYPQLLSTGVSECENFFDPNFYIDKILKVIFEHAESRKIVFSSFDPDICCLLQLKQNKYPVMFLTQGESHIYTAYMDFRCTTFANAINFAIAEQILGVNLHAEVLLRDMEVIKQVQEKKLTLFVWGADNNNPDLIRRLRNCKVDGIIYDRIDCHKPEHQFKFMASDNSIPMLEQPLKPTVIECCEEP